MTIVRQVGEHWVKDEISVEEWQHAIVRVMMRLANERPDICNRMGVLRTLSGLERQLDSPGRGRPPKLEDQGRPLEDLYRAILEAAIRLADIGPEVPYPRALRRTLAHFRRWEAQRQDRQAGRPTADRSELALHIIVSNALMEPRKRNAHAISSQLLDKGIYQYDIRTLQDLVAPILKELQKKPKIPNFAHRN
jgi:hypothetical protein